MIVFDSASNQQSTMQFGGVFHADLSSGPKRDAVFNYLNIMPYRLQITRCSYCLNNFNTCY